MDGWNDRIAVAVSTISRVRSASGLWEYYTDEDIPGGLIVFTGARSIRFEPSGLIPNDLIAGLEVGPLSWGGNPDPTKQLYRFTMNIAAGAGRGESLDVLVEIVAEGIHLEDPARPGVEIRE